MSLILPPYGKVLIAYQQESVRLEFVLYLFVGKQGRQEAYLNKASGTLCTFLPYGDDYKKYNWPIENQSVCVFDAGQNEAGLMKKLCLYLFENFNPRTVFTFSDDTNNSVYISREIPNG
jgi:hypothetical protein